MFAIVTQSGAATIVSNTERGAKNYATRHGYDIVYQVSKYSMTCYNFSHKIGKRWKKGERDAG